MNYELAKELKDAGFPMVHFNDCEESPFSINDDLYWSYRIPTLSELIEACGGSFEELRRFSNDAWECGGWSCWGAIGEMLWDESSSGKTPEEAVARLWLDLNKK